MSALRSRAKSGKHAGVAGRVSRWLPEQLSGGLALMCTMGVVAFLLFVMAVFGEQGIFRSRQIGRERALLEQQVASLERETARLRRRVEDVKSGKGSCEKAAREQLGLVKPGEVVYDFRVVGGR